MWERRYKERVEKGEYDRNTMYSCMKMKQMRPVETIPGMWGRGVKENDGEGESNYDIL
jgi:hypothetical protein